MARQPSDDSEQPGIDAMDVVRHSEAESIHWRTTQPGTEVLVEALDIGTDNVGSFKFVVVRLEGDQPDQTVHVELQTDGFSFVNGEDHTAVQLPAGTIMRAGVACRHYPEADGTMTYFGGMTVQRDFNFLDVITPDGRVVGEVIVPSISEIFPFMPEGDYSEPDNFDEYLTRVVEARERARVEHDDSVALLDRQIAERFPEIFEDEATLQAVMGILAGFSPEGRYNLAVLAESAFEAGTIGDYLSALQAAFKAEFVYTHPEVRGSDFVPASGRGFKMMIDTLSKADE